MNKCICVFLREEKTIVLPIEDADTNATTELIPVLEKAFSGEYPVLPRYPNYWLTGLRDGSNAFSLSLWSGDPEGERGAYMTIVYACDRSSAIRLWENLTMSIEFEIGAPSTALQPCETPWLAIKSEKTTIEGVEYGQICSYLTATLPWIRYGGEL